MKIKKRRKKTQIHRTKEEGIISAKIAYEKFKLIGFRLLLFTVAADDVFSLLFLLFVFFLLNI